MENTHHLYDAATIQSRPFLSIEAAISTPAVALWVGRPEDLGIAGEPPCLLRVDRSFATT
jgi:hypothetical protein